MKLCSACLLGIKCRYDGKIKKYPKVLEFAKKELLIPVCPEQLGGLSTPRSGSRIQSNNGKDVLNGCSKVLTNENQNVTKQYIQGAEETLKIAQLLGIKKVLFKQKSPSCGCGYTQGGLKKRTLKKGDGVTTALLKKHGIKVITEEDL